MNSLMNAFLARSVLLLVNISFGIADFSFLSNASQDCNVALREFAISTSHFTLCAIMYARPIKMCELCANNYTNVEAAYDKILKFEDDSGTPCKKKLVNVDRLEILENGYTYVRSLWQDAHCESCFEIINGTMTHELRNETIVFLDLFQKVNTCFSDNFKNGSYNESVCQDCRNFYNDMNEFYGRLEVIQAGNICVDIVDSVNATRTKWSETLRCDHKEMKLEVGLVAALVVVSLLPLVFYASTKHMSSRVETRLLQQKRLVQNISINHPSTSR